MPLSRLQYWGILVVGVLVFLAVDRVWDNPFAIDGSIVWSYLVVALLVPIALKIRGTLTLKNLLLYELELILLKYAITTCIAVAFWATSEPPPRPTAPVELVHAPRERPTPPPATAIPAEATGTIEGVVVRSDGAPVEGALVFVDSGLDALAFDVPEAPLVLENDGDGIRPTLAVLRTYQDLTLAVRDGQLHTVAGINERGEQVFSIPMVATGRATPYMTPRTLGLVRLVCRVHEHEGRAKPAHLLVIAHPFHTRSDAAGRFRLEMVPARLVTVRAFDGERDARAAVTPPRGASVEVRLPLGN